MGIFGSKDNQPVTATDSAAAPSAPVSLPVPDQPAIAQPTVAPSTEIPAVPPAAPVAQPAAADGFIMTPAPEPTPAMPAASNIPVIGTPSVPAEPVPVTPIVASDPVVSDSSPTTAPVLNPVAAMSVTDLSGSNDGDLGSLKQKALQELSPLVNHLDQSPEERFQTTMMMLQATDDQSLIKVAYDTAQEITDEKTRAQALLDVINEINYFTQQKSE